MNIVEYKQQFEELLGQIDENDENHVDYIILLEWLSKKISTLEKEWVATYPPHPHLQKEIPDTQKTQNTQNTQNTMPPQEKRN